MLTSNTFDWARRCFEKIPVEIRARVVWTTLIVSGRLTTQPKARWVNEGKNFKENRSLDQLPWQDWAIFLPRAISFGGFYFLLTLGNFLSNSIHYWATFSDIWAKFAQTIWSHCQLRKKQKTCFLHRDVGSFDFDVAFQDDDLSTNMTTKRRRRRCCCCCRRRQRRCWHLLPAFVVVFVAAFLYLWTWGRIYLWVTFRLFDNYSWSYSNILNFEKKIISGQLQTTTNLI